MQARYADRRLGGLTRIFIPTPERSLILILAATVLGIALAWEEAPARQVPLAAPPVSQALPASAPTTTPNPNPTATSAISSDLQAIALQVEDVLPLSRDLTVREELTGVTNNAAAGLTWPEPEIAARRYQELGRIQGFRSAFWQPGLSAGSNGVVDVQSHVSHYRDATSAANALTYEQERLQDTAASPLAFFQGDAAFAYQTTDGPFVRYFIGIAKGNTVATIAATALQEDNLAEAVLDLARVLSGRMQ